MSNSLKPEDHIKSGDSVGKENTREDDEFFDDENEGRKTLAEQIKEGKELKELEYRRQLEAQNSSYKLDNRSLQYYQSLQKQEAEAERLQKDRESEELRRYKLKKTIQKSTPSPFSTTESAKKKHTLIRKLAVAPERITPSTVDSPPQVPEKGPKNHEKISNDSSDPKDHKEPLKSILSGYSSESD